MALDAEVVADEALRRPVEEYFAWLTDRLARLLDDARDAGQIAPQAEPAELAAVGEAVRLALTESIGFPPEDRFQILTNHDGVISTLRVGTYLGVPRDDGIVYIDITMRRGRTDHVMLRARRVQLCGSNAAVGTAAFGPGSCIRT